MNIFQVYAEPQIFADTIHWFSILNYFFIFLTAGYILRLVIYGSSNKILTHTAIIGACVIITALNYYRIFTVSFLSIFLIYSILAILSYKFISAKSLKWINLSFALFILFIIGTYNLFNTKIHEITYPYFSVNDILQYSFQFKPYFEIYRPEINSLLGKVSFMVDGKLVEIVNDPIEFRIYSFYYVLNTIGVVFWLYIYFDILKKHNIKFSRIRSESKRGWLWIIPHEKNPVIHLEKKEIKHVE